MAEQLWADNQQLSIEKQQIATAIKRADTYSVFTRASIVIITITLLRMYTLGSLGEPWVICQLLAISYGAQWLSHNGSLVTADTDYVEAVAKVKTTMLVWVAALLVQVALYLMLDGLPDPATILDLFVVD